MTKKELSQARIKYSNHKSRAGRNGIGWEFTFDSWLDMWVKSGKWKKRGVQLGQYVMARKGDKGPYSPDNVRIMTNSDNSLERVMPEIFEDGWQERAHNFMKAVGYGTIAKNLGIDRERVKKWGQRGVPAAWIAAVEAQIRR